MATCENGVLQQQQPQALSAAALRVVADNFVLTAAVAAFGAVSAADWRFERSWRRGDSWLCVNRMIADVSQVGGLNVTKPRPAASPNMARPAAPKKKSVGSPEPTGKLRYVVLALKSAPCAMGPKGRRISSSPSSLMEDEDLVTRVEALRGNVSVQQRCAIDSVALVDDIAVIGFDAESDDALLVIHEVSRAVYTGAFQHIGFMDGIVRELGDAGGLKADLFTMALAYRLVQAHSALIRSVHLGRRIAATLPPDQIPARYRRFVDLCVKRHPDGRMVDASEKERILAEAASVDGSGFSVDTIDASVEERVSRSPFADRFMAGQGGNTPLNVILDGVRGFSNSPIERFGKELLGAQREAMSQLQSVLSISTSIIRRFRLEPRTVALFGSWVASACLARSMFVESRRGREASVFRSLVRVRCTTADTSSTQEATLATAAKHAVVATMRRAADQVSDAVRNEVQRQLGAGLTLEALYAAASADDAKQAAAKLKSLTQNDDDGDYGGSSLLAVISGVMRMAEEQVNILVRVGTVLATASMSPLMLLPPAFRLIAVRPRLLKWSTFTSTRRNAVSGRAALLQPSTVVDENLIDAAIATGRMPYPRAGRATLPHAAADDRTVTHFTLPDGPPKILPQYGVSALLAAAASSSARGSAVASEQGNTAPAVTWQGLLAVAASVVWPSTPPRAIRACLVKPQREWCMMVEEAYSGVDAVAVFLQRQNLEEVEEDLRICAAATTTESIAAEASVARRQRTKALQKVLQAYSSNNLSSSRRRLINSEGVLAELRAVGSDVSTMEALGELYGFIEIEQAVGIIAAQQIRQQVDRHAVALLHDAAAKACERWQRMLSSRFIAAAAGGDRLRVNLITDQVQSVEAYISDRMDNGHSGGSSLQRFLFTEHAAGLKSDVARQMRSLRAHLLMQRNIDRAAFQGQPLPWGRVFTCEGGATRGIEATTTRRSGGGLSIEFADVHFTYPDGTVGLRGVSFFLPAGQQLALVGESGCGKSTMIALLMRAVEPTHGVIRVGGVDVRELPPRWLRRLFAYVGQSAGVINQLSVDENVALGAADCQATQREVDEALRTADAFDFVRRGAVRGGGPQAASVGGSRGGAQSRQWSGGEQQRLAIARAAMRGAASVLVLDEATSALDVETERRVVARMSTARRQESSSTSAAPGATRVCVAHRLFSVRNSDLVLVLEAGEVVECGGWQELIADRQSRLRAACDLQNAGAASCQPGENAAVGGDAAVGKAVVSVEAALSRLRAVLQSVSSDRGVEACTRITKLCAAP